MFYIQRFEAFLCPSTVFFHTYTELIKTFCLPAFMLRNQRIVWKEMQHSVRFTIFPTHSSLCVLSRLSATLRFVTRSENDVLILSSWEMM